MAKAAATKPTTPAVDVPHEAIRVDPRTLIVGANVRLDPRLDKDFIDSVKERGVLVPIVAHRNEAGQIVVLYGQRRTLAAIETGRATVPVDIVVATPADVDRLIDQMAENDHRAPLTTHERTQGFQQLTALGVSAAQIAKRTATKRKDVDAGLKVAASAMASGAVERWGFLDLEQAAAVAEFEDEKDAVTDLVQAAQRGRGFEHVLQKWRDSRIEAAEKAAAVEALAATGVKIVEAPHYSSKTAASVDRLVDKEGQDITVESHTACPGHAAYMSNQWVYTDPDDTDDTDDTDEDDDEDDEERDANDDGPRRPGRRWVPIFVCTDFPTNGHKPRYAGHDSGSEKKKTADMTEAEREAASAERRDVIASNKAWDTAEKVRRRFLRTFAARKTPPKLAAVFIAVSLARSDHAVNTALTSSNRLAHELLGIEQGGYGSRGKTAADLLTNATDARGLVVALVIVLAAYEESTGRHSWRDHSTDTATTRYLRFLEACGYDLSDIELRACTKKKK